MLLAVWQEGVVLDIRTDSYNILGQPHALTRGGRHNLAKINELTIIFYRDYCRKILVSQDIKLLLAEYGLWNRELAKKYEPCAWKELRGRLYLSMLSKKYSKNEANIVLNRIRHKLHDLNMLGGIIQEYYNSERRKDEKDNCFPCAA